MTKDTDRVVKFWLMSSKQDIKKIDLMKRYTTNARRVKSSVDINPIGFTEEELKKADYFDIAGEIAEKGIVVYEAT
ncbi:MAG: hypothetical protein HS132_19160 [Planctomycetia bacterium]|nr:hypothetical protein [Planctomycetia bacterium]